jgi:Phosphotransferase enzyme family
MRADVRVTETYQYRSERLLRRMEVVMRKLAWPVDMGFLWRVWERESNVLLGSTPPSDLVVTHTDVWPPNIIVSTSGLTLVDFDDVAFASRSFDLSSALSEFVVEDSGMAIPNRAKAILQGYGTGSGIQIAECDVEQLVAGICCSYIAWLACNAGHGLDFLSSVHYLRRIERLDEPDVYFRLCSDLVRACDEVSWTH